MNHLDIVASSTRPDPLTAWNVVVRPHLGGDRLENGANQRPGRRGTAGHDARPMPRTLLATRYAGANELQPLGLDVFRSPFRVGKVRVSAVNDDVARLQNRDQLLDEI